MFSVVSNNNTPILPFIDHVESNSHDVALHRVLGQFDGAEAPRFFSGEPARGVRLAIALTTALLASRHDAQAVIIMGTADQIKAHRDGLPDAIDRAVQVARTGKVVELVTDLDDDARFKTDIRGTSGCFHLGAFDDEDDLDSQGSTGLFVFRADSFLTEAEILCNGMLALCQVVLETGQTSVLGTGEALSDLTTLSFWDGFWTRTDNRAAVLIDEQPATAPLHVPAKTAMERRSLQG